MLYKCSVRIAHGSRANRKLTVQFRRLCPTLAIALITSNPRSEWIADPENGTNRPVAHKGVADQISGTSLTNTRSGIDEALNSPQQTTVRLSLSPLPPGQRARVYTDPFRRRFLR
jgi:hypothetical protein